MLTFARKNVVSLDTFKKQALNNTIVVNLMLFLLNLSLKKSLKEHQDVI